MKVFNSSIWGRNVEEMVRGSNWSGLKEGEAKPQLEPGLSYNVFYLSYFILLAECYTDSFVIIFNF